MIDFTNCAVNKFKAYGGANGNKINVLYNGNWGILIDEQKQHAEIAPIYDCGSCLYPQMDVRDFATINELTVMSNLETHNVELMKSGKSKAERFEVNLLWRIILTV